MLTGEDRPGWVKMDCCYSSRLLHLAAERVSGSCSLRGSWEEEGRETGGRRRVDSGNTDSG